jgi:hypothetical protein
LNVIYVSRQITIRPQNLGLNRPCDATVTVEDERNVISRGLRRRRKATLVLESSVLNGKW